MAENKSIPGPGVGTTGGRTEEVKYGTIQGVTERFPPSLSARAHIRAFFYTARALIGSGASAERGREQD